MFANKADMTLRPEDLELFFFILDGFEDQQKLTVTIEPYVRPRTLNQNGLFYKYVNMIADYTGATKEEVKLEMKKHYGVRNEFGGLISTTKYTTTQMNNLIEGTRLFGTTELGIHMPLPDDLRDNNIK